MSYTVNVRNTLVLLKFLFLNISITKSILLLHAYDLSVENNLMTAITESLKFFL